MTRHITINFSKCFAGLSQSMPVRKIPSDRHGTQDELQEQNEVVRTCCNSFLYMKESKNLPKAERKPAK